MPIANGEEKLKFTKTKTNQAAAVPHKKKKNPRVRVRPRNKAFREETTPVEIPATQTDISNIGGTTSLKENTHQEFLEQRQYNAKFNMLTSSPPREQEQGKPIVQNELANAEIARELIKANREAKRKAKLAKKGKAVDVTSTASNDLEATPSTISFGSTLTLLPNVVKIGAEHGQRKLSTVKGEHVSRQTIGKPTTTATTTATTTITTAKVEGEKKKATLSKAERRAIQEAQRAAKAQSKAQKSKKMNIKTTTPLVSKKPVIETNNSLENRNSEKFVEFNYQLNNHTNNGNVKLFSHLERADSAINLFVNNPLIHPAMARLGEQYAKRTVVGSNARCMAFLNSLKMVIQDFETPANKEFVRSLETTLKYDIKHLHACRPLAVSVLNAYKHINNLLTQLPSGNPESESKERLCQFIDTYIENQVGKAAEAISESMQGKIKNGDVILTFGCSSLINYICKQAHARQVDFRVIIVDSRPFCEGREMLRRLTDNGISCTYVFINAVGFVMPEVTKVLLAAHALLSNGYVMARTGTAQVALVARSYNVPVLVCCETHKFSERFQTDAIVYNELGDPEDLVRNKACSLNNWQLKSRMTPLNLMYDITPPELVTAVVTDVSILPCTSVPVILRIKPAEIGYYG